MKTFSQYITEQKEKPGTYAAVRPTHEHAKKLADFMAINGIPNPEPADKLHSTLLYSRKHLPKYKPDSDLTHDAEIHNLEVWPTKSGKNCLVAKMHSPSLKARHKDLMNTHNAEYDYKDFTPHISLSYDIGDHDISNLKGLPKKIKMSHEYQEDLDTTGK